MSQRKAVSMLISVITMVAAFGLVLGAAFASATSAFASQTTNAPDHPNILYLTPQGSVRGLVNERAMQERGASIVRNWPAAQSITLAQRVDALVIDATLLDRMNLWDVTWLRTQYHDGVTVVGLGVDDDAFAQKLGLDTFRAPAEGNVPLGPTGYRMTASLALGTPEDLRTFELTDWLDRTIRGQHDDPNMPLIRNPATRIFSSSRGTLNSASELDGLFIRLYLSIEGIYKTRSDYAEQLTNWKH